jgi:hypothetical protein
MLGFVIDVSENPNVPILRGKEAQEEDGINCSETWLTNYQPIPEE